MATGQIEAVGQSGSGVMYSGRLDDRGGAERGDGAEHGSVVEHNGRSERGNRSDSGSEAKRRGGADQNIGAERGDLPDCGSGGSVAVTMRRWRGGRAAVRQRWHNG